MGFTCFESIIPLPGRKDLSIERRVSRDHAEKRAFVREEVAISEQFFAFTFLYRRRRIFRLFYHGTPCISA